MRKDNQRSADGRARTRAARLLSLAAARWLTVLVFIPFTVFFAGWLAPPAGLVEAAAPCGTIFLAAVLAVSLATVATSFRAILAGYRHGAGFPLGPSLLFASGALNIIMACRCLIALPACP